MLGGRSRALSGALTGAINGGLFADAVGRMQAMQHDDSMQGQREPRERQARRMTPQDLSGPSGYPRRRVVVVNGPRGMQPSPMEMFQGMDVRRMELLQQMWLQAQNEDPQMRPAASGAITTLPTHVVTDEEVAAMPEEHRACTICLEDFKAGDEQRTLPCFHRFHRSCADTWLAQSGTCPICKHRVDGAEEERPMVAESVRHAGA